MSELSHKGWFLKKKKINKVFILPNMFLVISFLEPQHEEFGLAMKSNK